MPDWPTNDGRSVIDRMREQGLIPEPESGQIVPLPGRAS